MKLAFLVMDLAFHARRDLARAFAEAYFRSSGDEEGRALLPYYAAYRAVIRAKVEGLKSAETEVSLRFSSSTTTTNRTIVRAEFSITTARIAMEALTGTIQGFWRM